ncbi:LysR substrate-binding domain-containing protein [Marinivivus vitaminiproducens]|uniref:LysR substrate-binding domain-containing protein n=1 Tax=Marinivivus vitaminiproducens TaxID=3035935 RepID=UPI0027980B03|nr:LysR substrate-binding domain-containing protein [Geminicoccaceae bacterium SCSIO 64248]
MNASLELRHLTYFICLADELHFGRAADRLGMAQAALSQQIRQLEDRLGVRLFERTTRRVKLTPAGLVMVEHAHALLNGVEEAVVHTRATADGRAGRLVIGGVQPALTRFLPGIARAFRLEHPGVMIEVRPLSTGEQLWALERGEIDIGFIRPTGLTTHIRTRTLAREGYVAVLPARHRLAGCASLSLEACAEEPMVCYAPTIGAAYRDLVFDAIRRLGKQPVVIQQTDRTLTIAVLVASGVGIGIVPAWIADMAIDGVVYRPIHDLPEAIELAVAWPAGHPSQAVRDLVAVATTLHADQGSGV